MIDDFADELFAVDGAVIGVVKFLDVVGEDDAVVGREGLEFGGMADEEFMLEDFIEDEGSSGVGEDLFEEGLDDDEREGFFEKSWGWLLIGEAFGQPGIVGAKVDASGI